ncbi:MAG: hypothetical protein Q8P35_01620 [Candidatus Yanofskybacteria bacterium]|nr:hypothetical protein [Candidatus Yanofskybacteria bacterium]
MSKIFIIVIVLVVLAGAVWYTQDLGRDDLGDSPTPTPGANPNDTSGIILEGANAVNVNDQIPGLRVVVDLAILAQPGFVAIYESDNGQTGDFIGASVLLLAGDNTDIIINARTSNEKEYIAVLHADTDNDKKFNLQSDIELKDDNGDTIMMEFMATANTLQR